MTDLWIVIPNWDKFQHYKDRHAPWIKLYTDLLYNADWLGLPGRCRGLLVDIWILYARTDGELPASPSWLARQMGFPTEWELRAWRERGESVVSDGRELVEDTVRMRDLKRLEDAGFIELTASRPLARRYTRERGRERLPKKVSEKPVDNSAEAEQRIKSLIRNGVLTDTVDLEAELRGEQLNSDIAERLRGMLETP